MPRPKYTIEEIKNVVTPIAQKYGVDNIYLFGSYARGDVHEAGRQFDSRHLKQRAVSGGR